MTNITILGGTGYAGSNVAREAVRRGHQVRVVARHLPAEPVPGVEYVEGDVATDSTLEGAVAGAEVVIEALAPRGPLAGELRGVVQRLASLAESAGVRLGVIGGAGSLLVAPEGPALSETPGFPEAFLAEAQEMGAVLSDLRASAEALDWFFVSPAANFGGFNPGSHTGKFRIGGDVLLSDDQGVSDISGADFAQAIVDEIERPTHRRARFSVAY